MSSSSDSDDLVDTAEPHSLLFCEKNPHNFRGSSVEVTVTQTTCIFQLMQIKLFKCKLSTFGEARREPYPIASTLPALSPRGRQGPAGDGGRRAGVGM